MKIDRQCPKCRYRCYQTVYPDVPSALGENTPGYVVAQCNGGLSCHHTWRARLTPSERAVFDAEHGEQKTRDLETKRLRGFYWIKGADGWEPAEWDPEHGGWFLNRTLSAVGFDDDDGVGEIGPAIPTPDDYTLADRLNPTSPGGDAGVRNPNAQVFEDRDFFPLEALFGSLVYLWQEDEHGCRAQLTFNRETVLAFAHATIAALTDLQANTQGGEK